MNIRGWVSSADRLLFSENQSRTEPHNCAELCGTTLERTYNLKRLQYKHRINDNKMYTNRPLHSPLQTKQAPTIPTKIPTNQKKAISLGWHRQRIIRCTTTTLGITTELNYFELQLSRQHNIGQTMIQNKEIQQINQQILEHQTTNHRTTNSKIFWQLIPVHSRILRSALHEQLSSGKYVVAERWSILVHSRILWSALHDQLSSGIHIAAIKLQQIS